MNFVISLYMMQIDLGGPVSTSLFNGCGSLTVRLQLGKLL